MAIRSATAEWKGSLVEGTGTVSTESGAVRNAAYSFPSRFEEGTGTNPEELIAAAHAGCFSMALSHGLAQAGHPPTRVRTEARVHLEKGDGGFSITRIELVCEAEVPGIDDDAFQEQAEGAKKGCPISRALGAVPIELKATLSG
jgi:lipoyl-dependent peroxiredoxin